MKDIAIGFNGLNEEEKMMLRHWLRNTLSDEVKEKLGGKIEDIFDILDDETISIKTGLTIDEVKVLRA